MMQEASCQVEIGLEEGGGMREEDGDKVVWGSARVVLGCRVAAMSYSRPFHAGLHLQVNSIRGRAHAVGHQLAAGGARRGMEQPTGFCQHCKSCLAHSTNKQLEQLEWGVFKALAGLTGTRHNVSGVGGEHECKPVP